ncbi:MAG: LacI family transcriptional regulator [Streptococcaceae bacterium]|jgi:LacI family transcriptional regulator|nr:LacI family transcriptional regulator [Streptococcaceae bacterium]
MIVTIDDVAKRVGVNKSTVSRALNGSSTISERTKKLIKETANEMGYVGNFHAKLLASRRVNAIGVVFPPIADKANQPFFMKILTSINKAARKNKMTVAIATGHSTEELNEQVDLMCRERRVDGFILLYANENDPVKDYLQSEKVPFVLLGTPEHDIETVNSVDNDNNAMGVAAAEYLKSLGHRDFAFFVDDIHGLFVRERIKGFIKVVGEAHCKLVNIFDNDFVKKNETAIVVLDDWMAVSLIERFRRENVNVPEDLSILSFNNSYLSELVQPTLTTYGINIEQLGKEAVKVLRQFIDTGRVHRKIVPFHLVERESVKNIAG